jgi:type I restriction enzyme M protein
VKTGNRQPWRIADVVQYCCGHEQINFVTYIEVYKPDDRAARTETPDGRFRYFTYDELIARDKVNLDIVWLEDPALDEAGSLLAPEVIAQEIVENLQTALAEFEAIAEALGGEVKPDIAAGEAIAEV